MGKRNKSASNGAPGYPYGIFLLFEGLPATIIESQVLVHANEMRKCSIKMDVWAFATTRKIYLESRQNLEKFKTDHNVAIKLIRGIRPIIPFSRHLNALILLTYLWANGKRPRFFHARTEYSAAVLAVIKSVVGFKLVWDARGDTLAEYGEKIKLYNPFAKFLGYYLLKKIKKWIGISVIYCDEAIFVSKQLACVQGGELDKRKVHIIPCLADEKVFFFSEELRSISRNRFGFSEDDVVFVYSGSVAPWQCVKQTVDLMVEVINGVNENLRSLIVTSNPDEFRKLIPRSYQDRFVIVAVALKEVNEYLNAADIAFLLREKNKINWVASPVKFAEYSMAGLMVVTNGNVAQVVCNGGILRNLITSNELLSTNLIGFLDLQERVERACSARKLYSRESFLRQYMDIYRG